MVGLRWPVGLSPDCGPLGKDQGLESEGRPVVRAGMKAGLLLAGVVLAGVTWTGLEMVPWEDRLGLLIAFIVLVLGSLRLKGFV